MYKAFLFLFTICLPVLGNAQNFKMGEFSPEEVSIKDVSYEPGASAVLLASTGDSRFFSQIFETTHFRRIKILSDAGKEYADVRVRYFAGQNRVEDINSVKAQVTNFVNGSPVSTKIEKDNIFDVDLGNGYREMRITFPNAQVGSILEYSYKKADKNLEFLDGWSFQSSIPTLYSRYKVTMIPKLEYKTIGQGSNYFLRSERQSDNGTYSWTLRDLYSLKEEPYMKNYRDYVDRVEFQLFRYQRAATTSGPEWTEFISTWEKLGDEMIEYYSMKGFYRSNPLEKDAVNVDLSGETELDRAKKAYYYIRDNFRNEGEDWIYTDQTLPQLLKSKSGAPGELILAYMGLLKSMGISCDPILIGSKGYGRSSITPYPFLNQFDEILLLAKLDGKDQFLDLSNSLAPFGYVDLDKHVEAGLLLRKNESHLINLDMNHNSNEIIFSNITLDKESGDLIMDYNIRSSFYEGLEKVVLSEQLKKDQKPLEEMFDTSELEYELSEVGLENLLEEKNYTNTKFKLTKANAIEEDVLIFNPLQFSSFSKNPFTQDFRVFPVDFEFAFSKSFTANIQVPEGYEVEDFPTNEVITIEGSPIVFKFQTEDLGQIFKITARVEVKKPLIQANQYGDLKYLMENIASKFNSPVILKKVSTE